MPLSAAQLSEFREVGYLNLGHLFSADELTEIGAEYDRLVTLEAQTLGNPRDGVFPYRAMLNFRSDTLKRFISHPDLLAVTVQLLGDDVRFWWDQGINKLAGSGSVIPWHQDNGYHRGRIPEYLTIWLALDDSSLANGGLEVIPGSHLEGLREHVMEDVHATIPSEHVAAEKAVALDAAAGEVLVFSTLLVHRTVGNHTSDRQRRAWVMQYARGDARDETTGIPCDDRPWVVRGGERVAEPWSERPFELGRHNGE